MFPRSKFPVLLTVGAALVPLWGCQAQSAPPAAVPSIQDAGSIFGSLSLVDEVNCASETGHEFTESAPGVSKVETILGQPCRTLPNEGDAKYFAYRLGAGKGLKPGATYLLTADFPEDKPRSMFICNRGNEVNRGIRTGNALGDVLYTYTNNNEESLKIPLSGKYRTWRTLFSLHDRFAGLSLPRGAEPRTETPEQGFWVVVTQSKADNDPMSAGAAVARIRLFEVPDPVKFNVALKTPTGLPQRHLFWREEMGDGVIQSQKANERGVENRTNWFEYKARLMQFLGMNTYTKDLLEFGHNQGWDSGPTDAWYYRAKQPETWANILGVMQKYGFSVLPYYEYAGGTGPQGLGKKKRATPLSGNASYTHITWSEKVNIDITDPDAVEEGKRLLDATIIRYKDQNKFVGAWFRPRISAWPISFSDATLQRYAAEANGGTPVPREELKGNKAALEAYYAWWFKKRRDFLVALRDHLRATGVPDAVVLMTADSSEPGRSLSGKQAIVTDDPGAWAPVVSQPQHAKIRVLDSKQVAAENQQLVALTKKPSTWGQWEWQHADPQADPQNYRDVEGVMQTVSFNRSYSVASPSPFDAFRNPSGLAMIKHLPLNENTMDKSLGYFVGDMEYAGPYCMLSEARAVAYGDPDYIGYLSSHNFNRGFPEYVRAFDANYLALPALPSEVLKDASPDAEVVVRAIKTKANGTYLAIVNTGLTDKNVTITLPTKGAVVDAVTGQALTAANSKLQLSLYPCELRTVKLQ
jgi:hypothetical protein